MLKGPVQGALSLALEEENSSYLQKAREGIEARLQLLFATRARQQIPGSGASLQWKALEAAHGYKCQRAEESTHGGGPWTARSDKPAISCMNSCKRKSGDT